MPRANRTRYTLLGTLTYGPMTGYDIKKFLQSSVSHFWNESYGQIYPALNALADEGLVNRTIEANGKHDRRIYSITPAGRAALRAWLEEPAGREAYRIEILLKLFFGNQLGPEACLRHLERYRQELVDDVAFLQEVKVRLQEHQKDHDGLPYFLVVIQHRILAQEALVTWCDDASASLGNLAAGGGAGPAGDEDEGRMGSVRQAAPLSAAADRTPPGPDHRTR